MKVKILIAAVAATFGVLTSGFANVNDYNMVCISSHGSQRGQIFVNTYSLNIGVRLNSQGGFLCDLETLLVQPVNGCKDCYDITAGTRGTHENIYVAKLRTTGCSRNMSCDAGALSYSVALYEKRGDGNEQSLVIGRSTCISNSPK